MQLLIVGRAQARPTAYCAPSMGNDWRVEVPYTRGSCLEVLASRKVVYREVSTEGSETAKSGTDEQKRDMRHSCLGKQAHLCNAL